MILLSADNVSFGFPGHDLFRNVSLTVQEGERAALVAPNGAGKTTFLRILRGVLEPDDGRVALAKDTTLGMLDQERELAEARTVGEALALPFAAQMRKSREAVELAERLSDGDAGTWNAYAQVLAELEMGDGFSVGHRIEALGADVGFTRDTFPRLLSTLSGGERRRLALAQLLLRAPSVLLLDEPTNHLDIEQIERLEARLTAWRGGMILVSHDRTFLARMATRVDELTDRGVTTYPYGFDKYLEERRIRLEHERKAYEIQVDEIKRQEEFIRRNFAAQKAKQAKSRERALLRIDRLERPRDVWGPLEARKLRFPDAPRTGKVVLTVENLAYGHPGRLLQQGLQFTLQPGDRMGIVGPNGSGKSSLLWAIAGQFDRRVAAEHRIEIRSGSVRLGHNVVPGVTDQNLEELDPKRTLIESIREIRGEMPDDACRQHLGKFQFHNEHTGREVASLSGGEKARLALARLLLMPKNLLVLDEPTNHLDIPSREILEEALVNWPGTVVLVSHDRTFLARVTNRTLHLGFAEHDLYAGGYADWVERERRRAQGERQPFAPPAPRTGGAKTTSSPPPRPTADRQAPRPAGAQDHAARKAAQRERERLERRHRMAEESIRALEAELKAIEQKMASLASTEWQKLTDMEEWRGRTLAEIDRFTTEWVESGEELEALAGSDPGE